MGKSASRIRGRVQHQCLGPRSQVLFHGFEIELESVLLPYRGAHRHTAEGRDEVRIARVVWIGQKHFRPRIQQSGEHQQHRSRATHGDRDAIRRNLDAVSCLVPGRYGLTKLRMTQRVGVMRSAVAQRTQGRFDGDARRVKVRLAHLQVNN